MKRRLHTVVVLALSVLVTATGALFMSGCGSDGTVAAGKSITTESAGSLAATTQTAAATAEQATLTSSGVMWTSPAQIVAATASPSVVNVRMSGISRSRFFGDQPYEGVGSGVIYSSDGYIITNEHVVSQGDQLADSVEVTFSTGETVPATIVATDSYTDIAVLKVDKTGLSAATFADDASVTVGEYAIAIGSPLDYSNSVTLGIVSGLGRSIENSGSTALVDLIQTDAAISPGNSGGALLDSDGRVIGINVAYMPANMTGAENIGFAIPADTAVAVAQQLISKGSASHAYMGINYVSMTTSLQRQYRLAVDTGVLVTAVAPQSPAGQAGLQAGDIITAMDGREVAVDTDLIMVLRAHQAGDSITVTVDRNGQTIDLTVNLGNRSDSTTSTTMPRASTQM